MCVALVALDAVVRLSGPRGERTVPITEFHLVPGDRPERETVLEPGEFVWIVEDSFAERGNGFGYTFPIGRPFLRLDRILAKGFRFVRTGVGGKQASDHRPVYADVALAP